jgi:hypothetical protein
MPVIGFKSDKTFNTFRINYNMYSQFQKKRENSRKQIN